MKQTRVIAVSVIVFVFLNVIENLVHYTIGRNADEADKAITHLKLKPPSKTDLLRIALTTVLFGIAQFVLTCMFTGCHHMFPKK